VRTFEFTDYSWSSSLDARTLIWPRLIMGMPNHFGHEFVLTFLLVGRSSWPNRFAKE
jgi:hypothetical protein